MIIHIIMLEKFTQPFIDIINNNFDKENHYFYIISKNNAIYDLDRSNKNMIEATPSNKVESLAVLLKKLYRSEKIIIHGLNSKVIDIVFFFQPWLLSKSYHVMWGGDFYFPEQQSFFKKMVIKQMGNFVTYIKGDYDLIRNWYGANGQYHECFMYTSNLYKEFDIKESVRGSIKIQVGNSADVTNEHFEIFEKLKKYKEEDIVIFVPLSYGDKEYAQKVITKGKEIFGEKFKPLVDFMEFQAYLDFLGEIDIAIFAHKRQQAMGNIITLLGLGKKVYLRDDITPWKMFNDLEMKLFNVKNIDIELISDDIKSKNKFLVKEYFSKENYLKQLQNLFKGK